MYEQAYIGELMVIERDARRFIYDLVDAVNSHAEFIKVVGQINSIANVQGQGRQDFAPELLECARNSPGGNQRVADLQNRVKGAFEKLVSYARTVKIYEVDPQLRNNKNLAHLLSDFEEAWVLGSEHLLDPKHREHLILFSALIESLQERYSEFRQMVESCDAQLFLSLPALVVLHNLKGIVKRFAPSL